jgi:hypothetical protein
VLYFCKGKVINIFRGHVLMAVREDIEKRIEREKQKISDLQKQIERCNAFILGMQEALKFIPKTGEKITKEYYFRSGDTKQAYEVLKQSAKPLSINEILSLIGKEPTKQNKASLSSSLHRAVKKSGLIKKVASNMFTITENEVNKEVEEPIDLPDGFGKDEKDIPF